MERAIFVPDLERLPPPGEPCDRVYLGSEFCVRRLPGERGLRAALDIAAARGLAFSLVTPFLDERGLAVTLALARALPQGAATEVVANDLGLIVRLREAGWHGTIVAGRLLTRQRRGPGFQAFDDSPPEAREALRGSALDSPAFVGLLGSAYGVRRFELDDLVQGVAIPELAADVRLSLYRPWLLVTATRNCPWVFDGRTWDGSSCARPCRGGTLRLTPQDRADRTRASYENGGGVARSGGPPAARSASRVPAAPAQAPTGVRSDRTPTTGTEFERSPGQMLVVGGCAQFLEHRNDAPPPPGVDRIVWQPEVPA